MENNASLETQIEGLLFWKAEPLSVKELAKILSKSSSEIEKALKSLEISLQNRGVMLMRKDAEVALMTTPSIGPLIETLSKEELGKDLGKAGLETLTITLYRGPIARREIDYVRGVNSTFILRNLLIRDLIERVPNPDDQRSFLYRPTFTLLAYLGIKNINELPEYSEVQKELETFKKNFESEREERTPVQDNPTPQQS